MKPIVPKFKRLDDVGNNIATQPSSSSGINSIKKNKKSFYQTRSTNFSVEQLNKNKSPNKKENIYKNIYKNYQTPPNKSPKKYEVRKNENSKNSLKDKIISVSVTPEKGKVTQDPIYDNSIIPTNTNSFLHLINKNDFGIFENIKWSLGLRDYSNAKIKIPESSNEPGFYLQDLEKFKKKQKRKYEHLITDLNPNFNKIQHLSNRNINNGNINLSQFKFSSCLRDYKTENNKINKEREKSWKYLPLPTIKSNIYESKYLSPKTPQGIHNFSKVEKYVPKNYEVKYGEAIVGSDKIKTKSLINNRNYTVCGFGECLAVPKYNNKFGDNNMFANRKILSNATNPQCKFELGLRLYGNQKTHSNRFNYIKKKK